MDTCENHNEFKKLTLGKPTLYHDKYNPTLLQAVPRSLNREPLGLHAGTLPFHGADIWTLYELSWLNSKGVPQVAIGEVHIDAMSHNLIESKSFKLYLNSFNQTQFANWQTVRQTIEQDLVRCAQGKVSVTLFNLNQVEGLPIAAFSGECIDHQDITIDNYALSNHYLEDAVSKIEIVDETLISHLLKSNCLITQQPDWGSIQIRYRGPRIDRSALLRYLIAFRQHNEFHEQCVERIFNDLLQFCQPEQLSVYARYTRRGGLDINPWRSNTSFIPEKGRLARQ